MDGLPGECRIAVVICFVGIAGQMMDGRWHDRSIARLSTLFVNNATYIASLAINSLQSLAQSIGLY